MKKIIKMLLLCTILTACNNDDDNNELLSQEEEAQLLQVQFSEIQTLASSVDCINHENWSYAPYGSNACGGPVEYIAYPNNIDTNRFLTLLEEYRVAQEEFNEKWEVFGDCSIPEEPAAII
ncbi:MAG: hypothetical protein AAF348_03175 [Bacteroidota bacterium]